MEQEEAIKILKEVSDGDDLFIGSYRFVHGYGKLWSVEFTCESNMDQEADAERIVEALNTVLNAQLSKSD